MLIKLHDYPISLSELLDAGGLVHHVQHLRGGEVIGEEFVHNLLPLEGRQHIWDVTCHAGSQITTWYTAIFEGNYTPVSTDGIHPLIL